LSPSPAARRGNIQKPTSLDGKKNRSTTCWGTTGISPLQQTKSEFPVKEIRVRLGCTSRFYAGLRASVTASSRAAMERAPQCRWEGIGVLRSEKLHADKYFYKKHIDDFGDSHMVLVPLVKPPVRKRSRSSQESPVRGSAKASSDKDSGLNRSRFLKVPFGFYRNR